MVLRSEMQIRHGSADTNINPTNYQEEFKQWTKLSGVSMRPTYTKPEYPEKNYALSDYEPKFEGIYTAGVGNSVPAHLAASEA
jgi:acetylxylan esterase